MKQTLTKQISRYYFLLMIVVSMMLFACGGKEDEASDVGLFGKITEAQEEGIIPEIEVIERTGSSISTDTDTDSSTDTSTEASGPFLSNVYVINETAKSVVVSNDISFETIFHTQAAESTVQEVANIPLETEILFVGIANPTDDRDLGLVASIAVDSTVNQVILVDAAAEALMLENLAEEADLSSFQLGMQPMSNTTTEDYQVFGSTEQSVSWFILEAASDYKFYVTTGTRQFVLRDSEGGLFFNQESAFVEFAETENLEVVPLVVEITTNQENALYVLVDEQTTPLSNMRCNCDQMLKSGSFVLNRALGSQVQFSISTELPRTDESTLASDSFIIEEETLTLNLSGNSLFGSAEAVTAEDASDEEESSAESDTSTDTES